MAITLVSQFDIKLVHAIEGKTSEYDSHCQTFIRPIYEHCIICLRARVGNFPMGFLKSDSFCGFEIVFKSDIF